jgi:hypothetical protein
MAKLLYCLAPLLRSSRKTGAVSSAPLNERWSFFADWPRTAVPFALLLLAACSAPPKPKTPALTPETANQLLHYNNKAQNWLTYVKKQNAACEYKLELPDQTNNPTEVDLDHIVVCSNRPSPKEFDAAVSFAFDPDTQKWMVSRFSS